MRASKPALRKSAECHPHATGMTAIDPEMFGFLKRTGNLEELVGSEFLLGFGELALRGRGPVRIVCTDLGFDLRLGPATLQTLDGRPWSVHPFSIEMGLADHLQLEGRSFSVHAGGFNVMELPDAVWFGPGLQLTERPTRVGHRILSTETVSLGITQERRFRRPLQEVKWVRAESARVQGAKPVSPPEVVHRSELPREHSAVCIAPELYAVLRDEQEGDARFTYPREAYDDALQRWGSAEVAVWDEEFPASASSVLRCLVGSCSLLVTSSLLLLPWLGPELQRRCRGTPIVQLLGTRLCWFDSTDASWHQVLRQEITRLKANNWGEPWAPPLRYKNGSWVAAGEAFDR